MADKTTPPNQDYARMQFERSDQLRDERRDAREADARAFQARATGADTDPIGTLIQQAGRTDRDPIGTLIQQNAPNNSDPVGDLLQNIQNRGELDRIVAASQNLRPRQADATPESARDSAGGNQPKPTPASCKVL